LKNEKYTLAMARTSDPHSATAQFFINVADNDFLNFTAPTANGWGYAVFGRVIEGMDVLAKLQRINPEDQGSKPDPDKIITAEVIRKRDHKYEPHKVQ